MITDRQLKEKWMQLYIDHGFNKIDGHSLIPDEEGSVLFTIAGMHPLVPNLLGKPHPAGNKLVNVQRCIRTNDIDSVGDDNHFTLFEMLGCWTLGECDKKAKINLSYKFLTEQLGIDAKKIAVTVFEGDENAPRDEEAADAWRQCGVEQIFYMPKSENWWKMAETGPCGPDSEMFIDTGAPKCCENCSPACDCGKYVEIGNDVFMQFNVLNDGDRPTLLPRPNIDTGIGLERALAAINGKKSAYEVGTLLSAIELVKNNSKSFIEKSARIIVDHMRAATFLLGDERPTMPSNVGQGYILRRLIRRAINHARKIELANESLVSLIELYINEYSLDYPDLGQNRELIISEFDKELNKFARAIDGGHKEFEKTIAGIERHRQFAKEGEVVENIISGKAAFRLYDTFGFPLELTKELAAERGYKVDEEGFKERFKEHQQASRVISSTAKGGLAESGEMPTRYHTATHLVMAALRKIVPGAAQKGSNITSERMRLDFNCDHKLSAEEIKYVEDFVNDAISKKLPVNMNEMSLEMARAEGAVGEFGDKYGEVVKVYTIGDISKEICGGPHVNNTQELGKFKIIKEESSSSGVRRIKAVLE